jgi:anti-sigma B factor antagonist
MWHLQIEDGSDMALRFRETADRIIVYFSAAKITDEDQIQETKQSLHEISQHAADEAKKLVIDFSGVQFMSSAMLGELVLISDFAKKNSLDLRLANLSPVLLEVFNISRLHRIFPFDDDGPDLLGATAPRPKPFDTDDGHMEPPKG